MTNPDLKTSPAQKQPPDNFNLPVFSVTDYTDIVSLDIETTGLDATQDEIIEIAAVKFSKDNKKIAYNSFVHLTGEIPHYIEYLTHITSQELRDAPEIKQVLNELKTFANDAVIVGHNISFDLDFINAKLINQGELPLFNQWWDTSELGRIYLPFSVNHRLGSLCEEFGISLTQAHRAINDAEATAELFFQLIEYILHNFGVTINSRILGLSRQAQTGSNLSGLLQMIVDFQRKYALIGGKPHPVSAPRNNIVENKCLKPEVFSQEQIFSPNGILQQNFPQFEFRAGQLEMAELIEQAFDDNHYLLAEAGTGVGKSFAYLIPALQFAYQKQKKVVVSTNTKNLQEQLFYKDLPVLKKILRIPYKAVLVKGRENYICMRKWEDLMQEQIRGITPYEAAGLLYLQVWKLQTNTGDITENSSFDRNRFSFLWHRIGSDRYTCAGKKCSHFNQCYVMKLRRTMDNADLIVINHSLLLSDLKSDNASLGKYEHLVIDEAHNLMQNASKQLGLELSYADLINQLNQISKLSKGKNITLLGQIEKALSNSVLSDTVKEQIRFLCSDLTELIEKHKKTVLQLFEYVTSELELRGSFGKLRIKKEEDFTALNRYLTDIVTFWKDLLKNLHALNNVFSGLNAQQIPSYDLLYEHLQGVEKRAADTENGLLILLNPDLEDYTMWLELAQRQDKNIPSAIICYTPIEVNHLLKEIVYDRIPCIVYTSATLALRNSFKFYKHQAGLDLLTDKLIIERVVDSPFNYHTQSRLMVAGFLPEPSDEKYFLPQALDVMELVLEGAPVGTLTLFTSYKDLEATYSRLNDLLYRKNRPLFAQGKWSSRSGILDEFKKHNNAVLLGTNSFWEGIDVQGESLSLLIIFKLPFQVPTEPVVEAYIEKLQKQNLNPFLHYTLPNALLRLRQGFGRLIRSKTDTGVVLILDPRVATNKFYGHFFQEVLPADCVIVDDALTLQSNIIEFFKRNHSYFNQD